MKCCFALQLLSEVYLLNLNWASIVYYDNGKEQIVANEVQMANGINISPDKRLVMLWLDVAQQSFLQKCQNLFVF